MASVSTHTVTAQMQDPPPGWDGVLTVKQARVGLDEGWAPYCQAEIVIALPESAHAEFLDPRDGVRVTIVTGQVWVYPPRAPQTRTFDLLLRERTIDHRSSEMTLLFDSDEAQLIDTALIGNTPDESRTVLASSLRAIINDVLLDFGAGLEPGPADFDFSGHPDSLVQEPGITYWDYLQSLVQASGLRLYCDELRVWRLISTSDMIDSQINLAATINLTEGRDRISRHSDWFDSVVVKYEWVDSAGDPQVSYDSAGVTLGGTGGLEYPLHSPGGALFYSSAKITGGKTHLVEWNRPYPGPGAAASILARAEGRGRVLDLDALSDYTTTPGMSLVATLPDTPIQSGVVSSVEWRFAAEGNSNEMTVGSRGLTDTSPYAWILADDFKTWDWFPPGVDWTEYTP